MRSVYGRRVSLPRDAEVDRALAIATAIALTALALFTLWLTAIAPRKPGRSRRAAAVAFILAGTGIGAFLPVHFVASLVACGVTDACFH